MIQTPFSSMVWVLSGSVIGSFGGVFLKIGANHLGDFNIKRLLANWRLVMGVACYLFSSIFFVNGLRRGELSVLYPMVALGSVWTVFWAKMFLEEPFTRTKFIALGLILAGVALLGLGSR